MAKRGRGRPSKLSVDIRKKLCMAVALGAPVELAVLYGKISESTFYDWMKQGEKEKAGEFHEFSEAIKEARGNHIVGNLAGIKAAGSEHWQALAWSLERRYPEYFGRSIQQVEHVGPNGAPLPSAQTQVNLQVNFVELVNTLRGLSVDELRILRCLANRPLEAQPAAVGEGNGSGTHEPEPS